MLHTSFMNTHKENMHILKENMRMIDADIQNLIWSLNLPWHLWCPKFFMTSEYKTGSQTFAPCFSHVSWNVTKIWVFLQLLGIEPSQHCPAAWCSSFRPEVDLGVWTLRPRSEKVFRLTQRRYRSGRCQIFHVSWMAVIDSRFSRRSTARGTCTGLVTVGPTKVNGL